MLHKNVRRPKIAVLMAAYNGERFIAEQIDSIMCQEGAQVTLFISLDKSSDNTLSIIKRKMEDYKSIELLDYGIKYGSAGQNFFRLICDVNLLPFDFIAFSDQDDLWLPTKLKRAIDQLKLSNAEAYSSNVMAVWANGSKKLIKKDYPQTRYDYLFESAGPGCTYVFKKNTFVQLQAFLLASKVNLKSMWLHDWLCYSYYRSRDHKWHIDANVTVFYRQHDANEVGANVNFQAFMNRARNLLTGQAANLVVNQAVFLNQEKLKPIIYLCEGRIGTWKLLLSFRELRRRKFDKFLILCYLSLRMLLGK